LDDDALVNFEQFCQIMKADKVVSLRLRTACRLQMKQTNDMRVLSSYTDAISVKVALGVLLLLFVVSFAEPVILDYSIERGLGLLTAAGRHRFQDARAGDLIPSQVVQQVNAWMGKGEPDSINGQVRYLDVMKKVYCNEFPSSVHPTYQVCADDDRPKYWGIRRNLDSIDDDIFGSDFRLRDLSSFRAPELGDDGLSAEELNNRTDSAAVIDVRRDVQMQAVLSLLTTCLVMSIILSGIILLTSDLKYLSNNLHRPLRELADDMDSIAQLQLAGVSPGEEDGGNADGTTEVRLIRSTFENMKKAIKSWGKYVPWPVVQKLLRANVEAEIDVREMEVTIFFSDIASFTTIVESMTPERSLQLLSRYFNDMSRVIDEHGGVVIEFIGDAILCIYGAPLPNLDHPSAACKSALRMLSALKRMNEWSVAKELPEVQIRCGVHTGQVLVGNMGFHSRMKYGIMGEDARIPSRLEELNKSYSTRMLISHDTLSRLSPADQFITRPIDYLNLRQTPGARGEYIHEVIGRARRGVAEHPMWPAARLHAIAMQDYMDKHFEQALANFEEVGRLIKEVKRQNAEEIGVAFVDDDDVASAVLARRCRAYIFQPPNPDWDGIWDRGGDGH